MGVYVYAEALADRDRAMCVASAAHIRSACPCLWFNIRALSQKDLNMQPNVNPGEPSQMYYCTI